MFAALRQAVRSLARQPAFTALAVLTFALGIGADTAIFTVADATLRRAVPFPRPDELVTLTETRNAGQWTDIDASYPDFVDWQERLHGFTAIAGYQEDGYSVRHEDGTALEVVATVTPDFFKVLEVEPALGRTFRKDDAAPAGARVVVITHGAWQSRFGGDPQVLGRTLTMDGKPYTIVGVLPRGYQYPGGVDGGMYTPLVPEGPQLVRRNLHWLRVIGRRAPGVSLAQASAEVDATARGLALAYPATNAGTGGHVVPFEDTVVGEVRPIVLVLLAAVALVLLIACGNVANLALARATARRRELAIRAALGASRRRIVGQLALESVVASLAGAGLGVVLAMWGVDVLVGVIPAVQLDGMPWLRGLGVDAAALGFAVLLALVVGVAVGVVPGLAASRQNLQALLAEEARATPGRARARVSDLLVAGEVALAFVLLVGAALIGRSLLAMLTVEPGFDPARALTVRLSLPDRLKDDRLQAAGHAELLERLGALPGVRAAASISVLPLTGTRNTIRFAVEGRPDRGRDADEEANIRIASRDYFQVAGVRLVAGRRFDAGDRLDTPKVAVVSESLARRVFPGEDPLGKRVRFTFKADNPPIEIVGVVADQRTTLDESAPPAIFLPFDQSPTPFTTIFLRAAGDPLALAPAVRAAIDRFDPGTAVLDVVTMDERVARSPYMFVHRFPAILVGAFAGLALLLAVVGLYGVLTYTVGQRTHEIGIRRAVGAAGGDIARLVLGRALSVVGAGLGVGALLSLAAAGLLRSFLFGIGAHDPATFVAVAGLLVIVALAACAAPVRRALAVDPMEALRG